MIDNYIVEVREELNYLVSKENAELYQGEILVMSQKLDKLIVLKQAMIARRAHSNYINQLKSILSPALYNKVMTC